MAPNYRVLLSLARKDIGLSANIDEIIRAMENNQEVAIAAFWRSINGFRHNPALPIKVTDAEGKPDWYRKF